MNFSDEDIRTVVKAGQYTRPEDTDLIAKTLIERRDMIGRAVKKTTLVARVSTNTRRDDNLSPLRHHLHRI
jgi:hypothetical protein